VILGWLILDEPITARTLVASAVIVTAVVLITLEKHKVPPAR
jgi:drug/metabolite transporter (DMT)-like permease